MTISMMVWFMMALLAIVVLVLIWLELRKHPPQASERTRLTPLMLVAHPEKAVIAYDLVNLAHHAVYVTTAVVKTEKHGKEAYNIYQLLPGNSSLTLFRQSMSSNNLLLVNRQEVTNQLLRFYYFQGNDLYESDSGEKGYVRSYDCHALQSGEVRTFPLSSSKDWKPLERLSAVTGDPSATPD